MVIKCRKVQELAHPIPSIDNMSPYRMELGQIKEALTWIGDNSSIAMRLPNLYQSCANEMLKLNAISDDMIKCQSTFPPNRNLLSEKEKIYRLGNQVYQMCSDPRKGVNLWSEKGRRFRFDKIGAKRVQGSKLTDQVMDKLYPRPKWFM